MQNPKTKSLYGNFPKPHRIQKTIFENINKNKFDQPKSKINTKTIKINMNTSISAGGRYFDKKAKDLSENDVWLKELKLKNREDGSKHQKIISISEKPQKCAIRQ